MRPVGVTIRGLGIRANSVGAIVFLNLEIEVLRVDTLCVSCIILRVFSLVNLFSQHSILLMEVSQSSISDHLSQGSGQTLKVLLLVNLDMVAILCQLNPLVLV